MNWSFQSCSVYHNPIHNIQIGTIVVVVAISIGMYLFEGNNNEAFASLVLLVGG